MSALKNALWALSNRKPKLYRGRYRKVLVKPKTPKREWPYSLGEN